MTRLSITLLLSFALAVVEVGESIAEDLEQVGRDAVAFCGRNYVPSKTIQIRCSDPNVSSLSPPPCSIETWLNRLSPLLESMRMP